MAGTTTTRRRATLNTRGCSPMRGSNLAAKTNPFRSDEQLQALFAQLNTMEVSSSSSTTSTAADHQQSFDQWQKQVVNRLDTILDQDGIEKAIEVNRSVVKAMANFQKTLTKVQGLQKPYSRGVKAQNILNRLKEGCLDMEQKLREMMHTDGKVNGYDKYQMAAALVRDNFAVFTHLQQHMEQLEQIEDAMMKDEVDRHILDAIATYQHRILSCSDISAYLGLEDVMLKIQGFAKAAAAAAVETKTAPTSPKKEEEEAASTTAATLVVARTLAEVATSSSACREEKFEDVYQLGDRLGEGAYGEVFVCKHRELGVERAVKLIHKESMSEWEYEDVIQEFQLLTKFDNNSVIRVYEFYDTEDTFYIVQELAQGGELFDELNKHGKLAERDVATLMKHILGCTMFLANNRIVHRDINLENVLLEQAGNYNSVKLIDFGLAATCEEGQKLYELVGKARYLAPEVLGDDGYGLGYDVWSCGIITAILLTGEFPFDADSDMDVYNQIMDGAYINYDSGKDWEGVSDSAKSFIQKLLTFDADARPTAAEMLNDPWITNNADDTQPPAGEVWSAATIRATTNNNSEVPAPTAVRRPNGATTTEAKPQPQEEPDAKTVPEEHASPDISKHNSDDQANELDASVSETEAETICTESQSDMGFRDSLSESLSSIDLSDLSPEEQEEIAELKRLIRQQEAELAKEERLIRQYDQELQQLEGEEREKAIEKETERRSHLQTMKDEISAMKARYQQALNKQAQKKELEKKQAKKEREQRALRKLEEERRRMAGLNPSWRQQQEKELAAQQEQLKQQRLKDEEAAAALAEQQRQQRMANRESRKAKMAALKKREEELRKSVRASVSPLSAKDLLSLQEQVAKQEAECDSIIQKTVAAASTNRKKGMRMPPKSKSAPADSEGARDAIAKARAAKAARRKSKKSSSMRASAA